MMITIGDIDRILRPIRNRISMIIGRAVLTAVNNAEKTQKVSLTLLAGETGSDVERFQEYGLETYPIAGAEALATFIAGNRDHGIVVKVHDRRYRPQTLEEGEVCLYTSLDADGGGHSVYLTKDKGIIIKGKDITVEASGKLVMTSEEDTEITAGGNLILDGTLIKHGANAVLGAGRVTDPIVASKIYTGSTKVLVE